MSRVSKASPSRSAFSRLSAGTVVREGPEPPGWGMTPDDCFQGADLCPDVWPKSSVMSLESVVTSLQKTTATIEQVRRAIEEVSRENASASRVEARQVNSLSELAGLWFQRANTGQHVPREHVGQGAGASGHRLLG